MIINITYTQIGELIMQREIKEEGKKLRDYQEKIINVLEVMETEYENYSTLVEIATGGGKTYLATRFLLKQFNEKKNVKVLWLTHRDFLLNQVDASFKECFTEEICPNSKDEIKEIKISSNEKSISDINNDIDIIFASIFSIDFDDNNNFIKWLKNIGDDKLYIIIDEAHHVGSSTYNILLEKLLGKNGYIKNYALIGLTATPFRNDYEEINLFKWFRQGYVEDYYEAKKGNYLEVDKTKLTDISEAGAIELGSLDELVSGQSNRQVVKNQGNKIKVIDIADLIKEGYILEPEFYRIDDFEAKDFDTKGNKTLDSIIENISHTKNLGRAVIFASKIPDVEYLVKGLRDKGVENVYGLTSTYIDILKEDDSKKIFSRDEVLGAFKEKKNGILITVDILSEGYDLPELNTIILIDRTNSNIKLRQRIGRVVRNTDNKNKDCKVIWYYHKHNSDNTLGNNNKKRITNNLGYDNFQPQDEASKKDDINRKTFYLTAPEYKNPIDYKKVYSVKDSRQYIYLLEILKLFKNNKDIKDLVGYYYDEDVKRVIYVDKVLNEGISQLQRRVHTEYLIHKHNKGSVSVNDIWGTTNESKSAYIKDVMEICFFLCKPSISATFYIEKGDIEYLIEYLVDHNCKLPSFENTGVKVRNLVQEVMDTEEYNNSEDILEKVKDLEGYSTLLNDDRLSPSLLDEMIKLCASTEIKNKEEEGKKELNDVKDTVKELEDIASKSGVVLTEEDIENLNEKELIKKAITVKYNEYFPENLELSLKRHNYMLRYHNGLFDKHFNYLRKVESGATWRNGFELCKCKVCKKDRPIVGMVFDYKKREVKCKDCKANEKSIRCFANFNSNSGYDTQVLAQSVLHSSHHLVVSKEDIEDFKVSIKNLLGYIGINDIDSLINDIICAIVYEEAGARGAGTKGAEETGAEEAKKAEEVEETGAEEAKKAGKSSGIYKRITLKELINLYLEAKAEIPRYLGYLLYDKVYDKLCYKVDFYQNYTFNSYKVYKDVRYVSAYCKNEASLRKEEDNILKNYGLQSGFFNAFNLDPVRDVITDCKPYIKVLRFYLGIKPDLLCRMTNFIVNQSNGCDTYLCGCGGSGADLINLRTNKVFEEQVYNEYGYVLTTFYKVLSNKGSFNKLVSKIDDFVRFILDYKNPKLEDEFGKQLIGTFLGKEEKFSALYNRSALEIGQEARNEIIEKSEKSIKRERKILFQSPIFSARYNENGVFDEKKFNKDIVPREETLHGVYKRCCALYKWSQNDLSDEEISEANIDDVDWAFIIFIYLSFGDRQFFDQSFIYYFIRFASRYRSILAMGYERVKDLKINEGKNEKERDIIALLQTEDYNKESCIAYCDIPYAETSDDMYVSKDFNLGGFVESLNKFKGYYIVSSRYNICAPDNIKTVYYNRLTEGEDKNLNGLDKFKKKVKNILNFYFMFTTEGGTVEIKDNDTKTVKMEEDRVPKYIVLPYTSKESVINFKTKTDDDSKNKKNKNNYRLDLLENKEDLLDDIDRMFKNTILSNIPVEVMLTNIDMLDKRNKGTEEYNLLQYYRIKDGIYALPTLNSEIESLNYNAEPIYLVFEYKIYLEMMVRALSGEEYEKIQAEKEKKEALDIFKKIFDEN